MCNVRCALTLLPFIDMILSLPVCFVRTVPLSFFSWVKFGEVRKLCVVGREHVCIAEDCYIEVINLNTNEIKLYRAIDKDHGVGVQCINGHKALPVFCFAEYCVKPRIFALTCPDFKQISVMTGSLRNEV